MKTLIKKILKESVEDKLFNKLSTMLKPPYVDFLKKNGLSDDEVVIVLKKFFEKVGGTVTIDFDGDICDAQIVKNGDGEDTVIKYHEDLGDFTGRDTVYWSLVYDKSTWVQRILDWVSTHKYVSSAGEKVYSFPYLGDVYRTDESGNRSWSKAPQYIKDDEFYKGII
jgi:hypothetical protein